MLRLLILLLVIYIQLWLFAVSYSCCLTLQVCQSLYRPFVCSRLNETENSQAMSAVQSHSVHWIQASTITVCLPSMIVGQILGTYSDTKGRKMPLLLPPLGKSITLVERSCSNKEQVIFLIPLSSNDQLLFFSISCWETCNIAVLFYMSWT